jgi:hypothetical protein
MANIFRIKEKASCAQENTAKRGSIFALVFVSDPYIGKTCAAGELPISRRFDAGAAARPSGDSRAGELVT